MAKPAHNRITEERIREECALRNHILLGFNHPFLKVRCHCGHEYEQNHRSYRAAKNSCKKCDSRRKSSPRPEHSRCITGENNPAKRPEVRKKISENTKGPRPHLVGKNKKWKPGVLEARSRWMSERRKSGELSSPGNLAATWAPTPEQRLLPGTLYLLRYIDCEGIHFKIGITKRPLSQRFRPEQILSVVRCYKSTLGECFDREQSLLKWAKDNGYRYASSSTTELIHPNGLPYLLTKFPKAPID